MSALTPDDDEETVNLASVTVILTSCALLFGLQRKGVIYDILCGFKATCMQSRKYGIDAPGVCPIVRSDGV